MQTKAPSLSELVSFLTRYSAANPGVSKEQLAGAVVEEFGLSCLRSVYFCGKFAIRFSKASSASFSNTIVGLSTLKRYDHLPFVVCIVRPEGIELILANTTFLKKISHSSQQLRIDNVRGSFLGHDILPAYGDKANAPENFEALFATHQEFTWEENLARLVEATNNIAATGTRFEPSEDQIASILGSVDIAKYLSEHSEYKSLGSTLKRIVDTNRTAILTAGRIDNVNVRGNAIEQIVTQSANVHGAEDLSFELRVGSRVMVDVKTKILTLASSPKAYNIDKLLSLLSVGRTVFSFFFIGLNPQDQTVSTSLVSILDRTILKATRIQFHWAGRNSRGVTQLSADLSSIFLADFQETVDVNNAKSFLRGLIEIPAATQD